MVYENYNMKLQFQPSIHMVNGGDTHIFPECPVVCGSGECVCCPFLEQSARHHVDLHVLENVTQNLKTAVMSIKGKWQISGGGEEIAKFRWCNGRDWTNGQRKKNQKI